MERATGVEALRVGKKPRVWDRPPGHWRGLPCGLERDKLIGEQKCERCQLL